MEWFDGQLTNIFGISIFWVARFAKIVQFISAMVILLEIFGKERVEILAGNIRSLLSRMVEAKPLRDAAKGLGSTALYTIIYIVWFSLTIFSLGISKKIRVKMIYYVDKSNEMVYSRQSDWFSVIFSIALAIIYLLKTSKWGFNLLYEIPLATLTSFGLTWLCVYTLLLPMLLLLIYIVIRPIEWSFDLFASFVLRTLVRRKLSQIWLIFSFCCLVLGFILEIIAS